MDIDCAQSPFDGVQRDVELFRELMGIEGAAREVAAIDFNRWNLSAAGVGAQNNFFRSQMLVDVDFAKHHAALAKKLFRTAAITAPERSVDGYIGHFGVNCEL